MAGAMFLKASALVAALCLVELALGEGCSATIPASTFTFPQVFNGNSEAFDWLISPSAVSTATPAGDAPCPAGVYVGQYSAGASDPAACMTAAPTTAPKGDEGCVYTSTQTTGSTTRTFAMTFECDAGATTVTAPASFAVTAGFGSSYTYTGTFKYAGMCKGAPGPGPGPAPGPGPSGDDAYEKEPCSGGCAFLIVFFVGMFVYFVAAIVFNIVTGKRGREAAPHTDFWSEIPSLVKDGVMFLVRVITCRASAGAGYQQV